MQYISQGKWKTHEKCALFVIKSLAFSQSRGPVLLIKLNLF